MTLSKDSKYHDIVESYMQNRLPLEGSHSSFQHLQDGPVEDLRRPPSAYCQKKPGLPKLVLSSEDDSESTGEFDENLLPYRCGFRSI